MICILLKCYHASNVCMLQNTSEYLQVLLYIYIYIYIYIMCSYPVITANITMYLSMLQYRFLSTMLQKLFCDRKCHCAYLTYMQLYEQVDTPINAIEQPFSHLKFFCFMSAHVLIPCSIFSVFSHFKVQHIKIVSIGRYIIFLQNFQILFVEKTLRQYNIVM